MFLDPLCLIQKVFLHRSRERDKDMYTEEKLTEWNAFLTTLGVQPKSLASHGKFLLPSSSGLSCVTVLEDYVRHYANAQLLAYEKQRSKNLYTAHKKETKLYFDKALDRYVQT